MSSEDTSHSSPKITHDADPDKPQGDPKIDVPSVQSAAVVESETTGVDEKTSTATTTVDATVVGAVTPSSHPLVSTSSEDPE
ncbi:hypothetical protein PHLCEN_2v461 [Hermanssonia centrifuga]|uniref:Uncharacterized protein n=1 Tax=Hermanssonia centrifuga TaxID=98765 RepID=A0A2R6S5S6_9APHY|nr:hypothetical protein PHLCEN_2v461 [Hermanssonia centrifuga]